MTSIGPFVSQSRSLVISHGVLALFGGVVHALKAYRGGETKGPMDVMVLAIISAFSGVIFAILALYFFPHQMYLSHAAAGAGGFLGVESLTLVAMKIRDMLANK